MRFPPKPGTLAKRVRTVLAAAGRALGRSVAALDDRPELGRSDGKEAGPVGRGYLEIVSHREGLGRLGSHDLRRCDPLHGLPLALWQLTTTSSLFHPSA
jgi:hypothetical protein